MESILQYATTGILVGGVYALVALGLVLIYKSTGVFNFAVGQLVLFGAFFFWTIAGRLGWSPWIALILSLACGALLGFLIERLVLRPLIGQPVFSSVIATLALTYFLGGVALAIWGGNFQHMPELISSVPLSLGGIIIQYDLLLSFISAMMIFGALVIFYRNSWIGLAMRATAESHQVAQARGIDVRRIFSVTWLLAGVIATFGGILLGFNLGLGSYLSLVALKAFPAVLLGGLDSILGAIIGGVAIGVLENLAGGLIASWVQDITPYVILLLVLLFKPQGLFGLKIIERI